MSGQAEDNTGRARVNKLESGNGRGSRGTGVAVKGQSCRASHDGESLKRMPAQRRRCSNADPFPPLLPLQVLHFLPYHRMNPARRLFSRTLATMSSSTVNFVTIPAPFDAHVHLRQGNLMKLVTPHVEQGGVRMAFVMVRLLSLSARTAKLTSV
jgi:hypothetical protein